MKKNNILIIIFTIIIITIAIFIFLNNSLKVDKKPTITDNVKENIDTTNSACKIVEKTYKITWKSMEPLIKDLQDIKAFENYYICNEIKREDIIIYKAFNTDWEIIKQIKALPWDNIKFSNKKLYINLKLMKNSIWKEYIFSEKEIEYMSMYVMDWKLQEWSYFAFWDNIENSIDSRVMWWLWKENFKAKVILK